MNHTVNLEDWRPGATFDTLRARARFMADIRAFFDARGYLEVETPIMARFGITDPYLANIRATFRGKDYCLQTSPEYHMKRLLAAGSGPIVQLARVFRDDELGRWHNPEFTLLEWYRPGIDHHALMDEVDALLQTLLNTAPMVRETYQTVFIRHAGIDPFTESLEGLCASLKAHGLDNVIDADEKDRDQYLFLLMSHVVEPALAASSVPVAVHGFPPSQSALAIVNNGFAERFEVYFRGVELANGFHELTDASAQRARFEDDMAIRASRGFPTALPDLWLLQALEAGMPAASGVAVGLDRLLALKLARTQLSDVMGFDFSRA